MKFVIFTLLFAGVSLAASENGFLGQLIGSLDTIPSLYELASSLREVNKQLNILSGKVEGTNDPNGIVNAIWEASADINGAITELTESTTNITSAIYADTHNGNLDLLKLDRVNGGLKALSSSEKRLASSAANIGKTVGGTAADVAQVRPNLDKLVQSKKDFTKSIDNIRGLTGFKLGVLSRTSGVVSGLRGFADSMSGLIKSLEGRYQELNQSNLQNLKPINEGFSNSAKAEDQIADSFENLLKLSETTEQ